jgi:hypothetical protein
MKIKRMFLSLIVGVLAFAASGVIAVAQRETATGVEVEKNLDLIRRDLRSEKKKILAANLPLTADEATRFWPVYDEYALDMSKHYDQFYITIKDYAANQKTLTDDQANAFIKRWSDEQVALAQTRQKYIPLIQKVIPGKKAALFFQIDRRLYAAMDLQVASEIPLVLQ